MHAAASSPPERIVHSDYVSSAEALAVLAVKPQTLYSYVSRGMIRRICVDGKTSLYSREDVRRLKARSSARSGHGAVAGGALQWGEPVLVTGITEIMENGPRYRDYLALDLAREGYSYKSVAEYLWTGNRTPVARLPLLKMKTGGDLPRQYARKPRRCQRTIVSGRRMVIARNSPRPQPGKPNEKSRSPLVKCTR